MQRLLPHAVLFLACLSLSPVLAQPAGWTGNMIRNPGFEEDFVNATAESHVLSFKGDWYYNQKDFIPDYWTLGGNWTWNATAPHAGRHTLKLAEKATAGQTFMRALYQQGGGAWGGVENVAVPIDAAEKGKFARPWRAAVWCRGGGKVSLACGRKPAVSAEAKAGDGWQLLTVELASENLDEPQHGVTVTLTGPGEFDDVTVEEKLPDAPNLAVNPSFEQVDKAGYPAGWSQQLKFRAIGPTYYVWTDWNHAFRDNRGAVTSDPLVTRSGQRSLRFDVLPGDEKLVESDLIVLNQEQPHPIEIGVFVRADRARQIDVRCVDEEGVYMPGVRASHPEYNTGGSALFGNGTFEWRYIRKVFATPLNRPVKGIRVRLCARGMNGHTLDDAGTRSYAMQVGMVWWDDVHVCECSTDAAAQKKRGVKPPNYPSLIAGPVAQPALDLGQRFWGENQMRFSFIGHAPSAKYQLKLSTQLSGGEPVTTLSNVVEVASGKGGELVVPYVIDRLAGELEKQGSFAVQLLLNGQPAASATYSFNTWPVVADIDVARHYNLPQENPVTASVNLGVADGTLAKTKKVELQLVRLADKKVLASQSIADLPKAFADTLAAIPKNKADSYEFNLPKPDWWVDRTNLLITKLDLSPLKTWPHNQPTRDTVLVVRGLDAAGKELFTQSSDPFCRVEAPPKQPEIQTVAIREDGAVLINGRPRFLTGATHQNQRIAHTLPIIAQLGLMGHRLTQQMTFKQHEEMWRDHALYALQMKPANKIDGTSPVVDLKPEQRAELEAFVAAGGMKNVVSINTGGWEATVDVSNAETVAKHLALHDYVRKLTNRPLAISTSGAYNAWWIPKLTFYDINHAETEMWGPMDFNVIFTPYMKRTSGRNTAWVYLPQLYENHPYERYRFETYENIIRGSAGVSMIQGIGDPSFNRGLAGELRYLDEPLNSLEPPPAVTLEPNVSHKVTRHQGKTYVLATNAGPIQIGDWRWNTEVKHSGRASHEGDSVNQMWKRPNGMRLHGFRGLPLPELIKSGDKIVQYVWLDPKETPEWVMVCVRGDGRFAHNAVLGKFDFPTFRSDYGNVFMYSELNHSVWHEINWVFDEPTYQRSLKVMGDKWSDNMRKNGDAARATVDKAIYQPEHFRFSGNLPATGQWHRIELDAEKFGLVGKLVDGFAYLTKNGRALWDLSVLERNGEVARVFCEDTVGIDRSLLSSVRINVPGLKQGTKVRALFETREIIADDGGFSDNFEGTDTYGTEAGAVVGDLFGFVKDEDRELARMLPSGYGYSYGPTAVHIYEIGP